MTLEHRPTKLLTCVGSIHPMDEGAHADALIKELLTREGYAEESADYLREIVYTAVPLLVSGAVTLNSSAAPDAVAPTGPRTVVRLSDEQILNLKMTLDTFVSAELGYRGVFLGRARIIENAVLAANGLIAP